MKYLSCCLHYQRVLINSKLIIIKEDNVVCKVPAIVKFFSVHSAQL